MGDTVEFRSWIRDAKTDRDGSIGTCIFEFVFAATICAWANLRIYIPTASILFLGASSGASPSGESLESYVFVVGEVKSRDGDFVANGCAIGCDSEILGRACRSSLAADALALSA